MAIIDNLISYYKLYDNAANTTVLDSHGSNNGILSVNTNTLYSSSGIIDGCCDYTGSQRTNITGMATAGNTWTVSYWIKVEDADLAVASKIWDSSAGRALTEWNDAAGTGWLFYDTTYRSYHNTLGYNVWQHHVITQTGTDMDCYVNGIHVQDLTTSGNSIGGNVFIGSRITAVNYFTGKICEFGFWDRALTSTEASALYNSGNGLAYPFTGATVRLIKLGGTFVEKPILTKVSGTFVDKPIKIKVGGTFQDA